MSGSALTVAFGDSAQARLGSSLITVATILGCNSREVLFRQQNHELLDREPFRVGLGLQFEVGLWCERHSQVAGVTYWECDELIAASEVLNRNGQRVSKTLQHAGTWECHSLLIAGHLAVIDASFSPELPLSEARTLARLS